MKVPEFLQGNENWSKINGMTMETLDRVQKKLPELDVQEVPYFIFFDTKGIAYETNSETEAEKFLKE